MMKFWIKNIIYLLSTLVVLSGCNPEIEVPVPSKGSVDFSNYVAVGNSLTAGYSDNGLYADGQSQSFPSLIAGQMHEISMIEFRQPDIPGNGSGYVYVSSLDLTTNPPAVSFGQFTEDPNWLNQIDGPFNNMGVPGIRVKDITVNGYGAIPQLNPYFYRMLGGKSATTSYLEMVQENPPTFFTSWLGNNDVLGYASSGGVAGITGAPITGLGGLTNPTTEFKPSYDALIAALTSSGAKGVVVTIPDITLTPFFTRIPWNGLVLDAPTAALANQFYQISIDTTVQKGVEQQVIFGAATQQVYESAYQQAIDSGASDGEATAIAENFVASEDGQSAIAEANDIISLSYYGLTEDQRPNHPLYPAIQQNKTAIMAQLDAAGLIPEFNEGPNPFVIEVPITQENPLGLRQMAAGELVLLSAQLGGQLTGQAALSPKPDQYILTTEEVKNINDYTADFNDIIRDFASSNPDIALLESNEALEDVRDGLWQDGVNVTADYLTGGAFSLDGVHLTPRGYAIIANRIIEVINDNFDATISPVNINNYRAVVLP